LQWKILVNLWPFWFILPSFGLFCDQFVDFIIIWNIFSRFGMLHQEKSGNPVSDSDGKFWRSRKYDLRSSTW
jgi:hypothetical protein